MHAIEPNLPMKDYLAHPGYGSSDLRTFRNGPPALVKWRRQHREDTQATIIGSAAACKILDPTTWDSMFWVKPEGLEFRSKENKDLRDRILEQGLTILSQSDAVQVQQIVDAFHSKERLSACLKNATAREASVFWKCNYSLLQRKARPDWWDHEAIYDLKISVHAQKSLRSLFFMAQQQGWLEQLAGGRAGLAAHGIHVKVGRIVVIAPNPPQALQTWMLEVSEHDLDIFELQNEQAAAGVAQCEATGRWPGTPDDWIPFEVVGIINEIDTKGAEEEDGDDDNPLI